MLAWMGMELLAAGVALAVLVVALRRWPGALVRWWPRLREARRRMLAEDALKQIHQAGLHGEPATPDSLTAALGLSSNATAKLVARMETQGWLRSAEEGLSLTAEGARLALQVIRAHRLWERYLVDEARMPLASVHAEAERREHTHAPEAVDALDAAMGHPATDPHGAPIPTADGALAALPTQVLTDWPVGTAARIVHLEDEPPAVFAQIAAEGLCPGRLIHVVESEAGRVVLSDGEGTHVLAPTLAANIFVTSVEEARRPTVRPRLSSLKPGERATVHQLDDALQGFTRRRLLDLGLTPGTEIAVEMLGVFRDPVAYRVRGTLIALRRDQARHVLINTRTQGARRDSRTSEPHAQGQAGHG